MTNPFSWGKNAPIVFSSIKIKILTGFLVVLACFISAILSNIYTSRLIKTELAMVNAGYVPLSRAIANLRAIQLSEAKAPASGTTVAGVHGGIEELLLINIIQKQLDDAHRLLLRIGRSVSSSTEERAREKIGDVVDELARLNAAARMAPARQRYDRLQSLLSYQKSKIDPVLVSLDTIITLKSITIEKLEAQSFLINIALLSLAVVIALVFMVAVYQTLNQLSTLNSAAFEIGKGKYDHPISITSKNEIGSLARALKQMAQNLKMREIQLNEQQNLLIQSERLALVGRVAAQITHEIKNPLNSIGLNLELLMEHVRANPSVPKSAFDTLQAIDREVARLNTVAEGYLQRVKPPRPNKKPVDLNAVCRMTLELFQPEFEKKKITGVFDLDDAAARITVDEAHIRQALVNIIKNAVDALEKSPVREIRITTRKTAIAASIAIRDTGRGIPPSELAKVFQPFYTTKEDGTGLGLSVTEQVIKANGGLLRCESKPGEGTTFTIEFPATSEGRP